MISRRDKLDALHHARAHRARIHRARIHHGRIPRTRATRAQTYRAPVARAQTYRAPVARAQTYRAPVARARINQPRASRALTSRVRPNLVRPNLVRAIRARATVAQANLVRAHLARAIRIRAHRARTKVERTKLARTIRARASVAQANFEQAKTSPAMLTVARELVRWGTLPTLTLVGACGVLLEALAAVGGRSQAAWALPVFWLGLVALYLPFAARLLSPRPTRSERIGLVCVLGIELYFAALVVHFPPAMGFDAYLHWSTAQSIAATHHLFAPNPLLPISPLYPGLEIITDALSGISGLPLLTAGLIVIGAAHVVLLLALYLFIEQIGLAPRVAGLVVALYVANPHYLSFDTGFSYESLALPLGAFILWIVAWLTRHARARSSGMVVALVLGLAALTVTHHVTSYLLAIFLGLWLVAMQITRDARWRVVGGAAVLASVFPVVWALTMSGAVIGYLAPIFLGAVQQMAALVLGHGAGRRVFQDGAGAVTPAWERVTAIASVLLVLGGLVVGLRLTWRRHRTNAVIVALAVAGGLYPVTQAFRLTAAGSETADRATAFVFVGIGCVVALALVELRRTHPTWRRHALLAAALAIGFVGQVVVGAGPAWAQLPGPYLVSADSRSIDAEGIDAARWALTYLGPGNRVGTDRVNRLLMATYGRQYTVTTLSDPIGIADVFFAPTLGPEQVKILRELRVRYLVVDMRLSTGLPRIGVYFEADEPGVPHMTPISPGALAKFDHDPRISRCFDSGDIVIYDLGGLSNGS